MSLKLYVLSDRYIGRRPPLYDPLAAYFPISLCYNCPLLRTGLDTRLLPSLFFRGVLGTCRGVGVGVSLALRTNGACRVSRTSPKEWPASLTSVSLMLPLIIPASLTRVSATPALALLTGLEARLPPNLFLCGVFGHCGSEEEGVSLDRRCNAGSSCTWSLAPPLRQPASHLRDAFIKKLRDYLGIFPNIGGGGLLIPKTFVILTIALKTPLKHLKTP